MDILRTLAILWKLRQRMSKHGHRETRRDPEPKSSEQWWWLEDSEKLSDSAGSTDTGLERIHLDLIWDVREKRMISEFPNMSNGMDVGITVKRWEKSKFRGRWNQSASSVQVNFDTSFSYLSGHVQEACTYVWRYIWGIQLCNQY